MTTLAEVTRDALYLGGVSEPTSELVGDVIRAAGRIMAPADPESREYHRWRVLSLELARLEEHLRP